VSASRQLPEGWAWATLDEFTQGRGQSLDPSRHKAETFELYSIPGFDAGAPELLNGSAIGSAKQMVNAGDVLLSKINPRINRVWLVGEDRGFRQIASTEWIVFPRNDYINGDYLKFFLRQHHVRNFLASNVSGVGGSLMRIKASTLDGYPIPVAPRDEQRRIVEKIEALFAELDKGEDLSASSSSVASICGWGERRRPGVRTRRSRKSGSAPSQPTSLQMRRSHRATSWRRRFCQGRVASCGRGRSLVQDSMKC
jgi:Restriction endonuclease S subunits